MRCILRRRCFCQLLAKLISLRQRTFARTLVIGICITVLSLICISYFGVRYADEILRTKPLPYLDVPCYHHELSLHSSISSLTQVRHNQRRLRRIRRRAQEKNMSSSTKVLLLVKSQYSPLGQRIINLLEHARFPFKVEYARKGLPYLTKADKGKYSVIVFENFQSYLSMDKWNRQLLDKYCLQYKVGIIGFVSPWRNNPNMKTAYDDVKLTGMPLFVHNNLTLRDYYLSANSRLLRIAKKGRLLRGLLDSSRFVTFSIPNPNFFDAISFVEAVNERPGSVDGGLESTEDDNEDTETISQVPGSLRFRNVIPGADPGQILKPVVVHDLGKIDHIERVLFGGDLNFWLHRVLFLDALGWLSGGRFQRALNRYFVVDVDDIFVGRKGIRLKADDVEAMVAAQKAWLRWVPGFKWNLGFSGSFFHHGSWRENLGDDRILEHAKEFWWFPHMWHHTQAHHYSSTKRLEEDMLKNLAFAKQKGIPTNAQYAISPHHSGVYPVFEPLYRYWSSVWNVRVTATEEYPHLRPARHRRGFVHRGIKVLPRQTCGIYTHTIFLDKYPRGKQRLISSVLGGDVFHSFLYNPVNVFMTHMSNYGGDRLGVYLFDAAFRFIRCWTNLKLEVRHPLSLAKKYFETFPHDVDPLWSSPENDIRHQLIWPANKSFAFPKVLVIGPQKTGTTALYTFMNLHPKLQRNFPHARTFEEIQFFNGANYYKGIDWYMQYFPKNVSSERLLFEKSATYFDSGRAPERVFSLLPRARIIAVLISPGQRAYSWYQHMRAHNDRTAMQYSFEEVLNAKDSLLAEQPALRKLRQRCLQPGVYAHHLERWFRHYSAKQIFLVDGNELRHNPSTVMTNLQLFLNLTPQLDYSQFLRFDKAKGFFCVGDSAISKSFCLGRSKGRHYAPLTPSTELWLRRYYRRHNVALVKIFRRYGYPIHEWLHKDLEDAQL